MYLPTARQRWPLLTDDDLRIAGDDLDLLAVRIVARYGIAKEWADRAIDDWLADLAAMPLRAAAGGG